MKHLWGQKLSFILVVLLLFYYIIIIIIIIIFKAWYGHTSTNNECPLVEGAG